MDDKHEDEERSYTTTVEKPFLVRDVRVVSRIIFVFVDKIII